MTNKKKNKAKAMSKKTGMSYAEAINVLNKNQQTDGYKEIADGYIDGYKTIPNDYSSVNDGYDDGYNDGYLDYNSIKELLKAMETLSKNMNTNKLLHLAKEGLDKEIKIKEIIELSKFNIFKDNFVFIDETFSLHSLIVEAKAYVERWDTVVTHIILNDIYESNFIKLSQAGLHLITVKDNCYYMYGAEVLFRNNVEKNTAIGFSETNNIISKITVKDVKNKIDNKIINKIKKSKLNNIVINSENLELIFYHDDFIANNNIKYLVGKINNKLIYLSNLANGVEFFDDDFNFTNFELNKLSSFNIIKRISKQLETNSGICMSINCFNDLLNVPDSRNIITTVTSRKNLQLGHYGYFIYNNLQNPIYVSKLCDSDEILGLSEDLINKINETNGMAAPDVLLDFFEKHEREKGVFSEKFKNAYMYRKKALAGESSLMLKDLGYSILSERGKFLAIKEFDGHFNKHEFPYPLEFPLTI